MVWEILVSEQDIRALVPLAKAEELVNTAPLTGVPRRILCALSQWTVAELWWR